MRFPELTLMPQSTRRTLLLANLDAKRTVTKVNGKSIRAAAERFPDQICFENRSMFGGGECYSYSDLIGLGVKSLLVRCNDDRDLVTIKVG